MKYNSIGEQLIAKAKEIDPNYKPDKFNDMSEALGVILNNAGGSAAIFEVTSEQASKLTEGFDITDEQYQFIITNKSVNCLIRVQDTNVEFPVAFTRVIENDQIVAYFSLGIYMALSFSSDDVNPKTNKRRLRFEINIMDFYSSMFIADNEQRYSIYGSDYSTYFDTIKGVNILHTYSNDTKDWQFTEDKTISLFGNHSILVPKNSADTNILPLPADASTSTYALKSVNGTVQWVKES